jgi:hypothetical protein
MTTWEKPVFELRTLDHTLLATLNGYATAMLQAHALAATHRCRVVVWRKGEIVWTERAP